MSGINGVEIHDVFGLSQPLNKLVETVSKAIGKAYAPTHIRKIARAKADEIKIISSALNDTINLPAIYANGDITIKTNDYKELAQRACNRLLYQELKKQENIENILHYAYDELKKEDSVSDQSVDEDWTIRFFNSVEDISNEKMQEIWGKILAGEIKKPNSFSLRTLDTIKNLSQKEAELFQKIADYILCCMKQYFLYNEESIFSKYNIFYSDFLLLEECNLLTTQALAFTVNIQENKKIPVFNKDIVGIFKTTLTGEHKLSIDIYSLTRSGEQLFNIINTTPNNAYTLDVFQDINKKAKNYKCCAYPVNYMKNGKINYDDDIDLLLKDQ
jgi:hypothetical protein